MSQINLINSVARSVGYWAAHTLHERRRAGIDSYWSSLYSKGQRDANMAVLRVLLRLKPKRVRRAAGQSIKENFRWCCREVLKKGTVAA